MKKLRKLKNIDYGNSFLQSYTDENPINTSMGNMSIYYDIHRKVSRLDNFLLNNKMNVVKNETINDTLMDLAIICINALIALEKKKSEINE